MDGFEPLSLLARSLPQEKVRCSMFRRRDVPFQLGGSSCLPMCGSSAAGMSLILQSGLALCK